MFFSPSSSHLNPWSSTTITASHCNSLLFTPSTCFTRKKSHPWLKSAFLPFTYMLEATSGCRKHTDIMLDHILSSWQLNIYGTLSLTSNALTFSHAMLFILRHSHFFAFTLICQACLPSSSHLVHDLLPISLGKVVAIRALPYSPTAICVCIATLPHFPLMHFPCSRIWNALLFVYWIPTLLVYSRKFLEFCPFNISTSPGIFPHVVYSHSYSNNVFLILNKKITLWPTASCNYCSVPALHKNTWKSSR